MHYIMLEEEYYEWSPDMTESEVLSSIDQDNRCEYSASTGRQVCTYNPDGVPSFDDRQFVGYKLGYYHVVWETDDVILAFQLFGPIELKDPCLENNVEITTVTSSDYTITHDSVSNNIEMNYVMKVNFNNPDYFDTSRELGLYNGDEYLACGPMTTNPFIFTPNLS